MPYASDHVENEYVVPLPQKDPYESHDRSLLSLWSFYTQACQRVQTEHSLHTLSGFEHAKAKRELAEGNNAGDPLNVVTKRNRLHVFHSLSNGEVPRKIASLPIPVVIDDLIPVPVVTPDRMSTGGVSNALCANSPSFTPVSQKHRLELEILSPPTSIKDKVSSPVSVSDIWNTTLQSLDDDSSMSAFNSPSFSRSVLSDDCEIAEESKNAAFVKRGYTEPCTYPSSMQEYSGASPLQSQHFKLPILCSANIMKHNSVLKGYVCEAYSKSNNFESLSESITLLSHTHAVDTAVMSADLHDHKLDLELQLDLTYMDSDDEAEEELYGIQQLSKGFMSPLSFEDSISSRTHSSTSTTLSAVNNGPDDDDDDDDCLGSEMSFGSFNFFKSHRQAITRSPTMRDLNAFGSLTIKDCSSSMPELPPSL